MKSDGTNTLLNVDKTPLLVDIHDELKDPEVIEGRTSPSKRKRTFDPGLWRENAKLYFTVKPLKLAVYKDKGGCCSCFADCLPAACNSCWFLCACCCFFAWSSLPRFNCLLDFIILFVLYCQNFYWNWSRIEDDIILFDFEKSRCDIVFLALIRTTILFFVFAYRNHREWYEFNLFWGVLIAIASTLYGLFKLFSDPKDTDEFMIHGGDFPTVIIFFMSWIWLEVLIFGCVRRKKIRIPIEAAKSAVRRKAQSAYDAFARTRGRRLFSDSEESITGEGEHKISEQDQLPIIRDEGYFGKNKEIVSTNGQLYPIVKRSYCSVQQDEAGRSSNIMIPAKCLSSSSLRDDTEHKQFSNSSFHSKIPDLEFSKYERPLRYPTSSFLKIRGINVHLRTEAGDLPPDRGPVFLCLHGFGGGVFSFSHSWKHLRTMCSTIVAFDRPGFGLTTRKLRPWSENPYRVDFAVDICCKILAKLEVTRVVLIAHGSGCLLANYFCIYHPEHVESLVMISPAFHAPTLIRSLFKTRLGKAVITQLVRTEMSMITMRRAWMNSDNIPEGLEKQYKCILELDNWDNAIWEMLQIELPDQDQLMSDFGKTGVPVLLLHGQEDKIIDISETEELARKWRNCNPRRNICFVPLENVGHVVHEEFPELLFQKLRLFLNGEEERIEEEKEFGKMLTQTLDVNFVRDDEEKRIK